MAVDRDGLHVACGADLLVLGEIQLAGGKRVRAADFANAHPCLDVALGA